jgi:hypothetical protein
MEIEVDGDESTENVTLEDGVVAKATAPTEDNVTKPEKVPDKGNPTP